MKYKIAICDDSDADREYVLNMVNRWAAGAGQVVHTDTFTSAENFLMNQVRKNYCLSEATDFDQQLKATWKELLKGEFAYFAFLKRNDLCEKELGIEAWQKLLPFPESEVGLGGAEQNPGY